MHTLQTREELEQWYSDPDPWEYESSVEDAARRSTLLAAIPEKKYKRVLDIGCGEGFITSKLPGEEIIGLDLSQQAITRAREKHFPRITFQQGDLFELSSRGWNEAFDLVVITGVLYPQYIGDSAALVYQIIDRLLQPWGVLASCHIDEWYSLRFPYVTLERQYYSYKNYSHVLEVAVK